MKLGDGVTTWNNLTYTVMPLPAATPSALGGVVAAAKGNGDTVEVKIDGTTHKLYVPGYPSLPALATVATSGNYNDLTGRPSIPLPYTLPVASPFRLGGIMVGDGLNYDADGTVSAVQMNLGTQTVTGGTTVYLDGIFTRAGQIKTYYCTSKVPAGTISFKLTNGDLYSQNGDMPSASNIAFGAILIIHAQCISYYKTPVIVIGWQSYELRLVV